MIEMAKAYDLNLYEYLKFLLENRLSKRMSDDELAKLAPWDKRVQKLYKNKWSKMLVFPNPSTEKKILSHGNYRLSYISF